MKTVRIYAFALLCACLAMPAWAQRESRDLSMNNWELTLDTLAKWQSDSLMLPPVDVKSLPQNVPTGGWTLLDSPNKRGVHLPATVEGEMWGWNGSTYGVSGNYVGVSWWHTQTDIPSSWTGRRITLEFSAVRFRAEIFVNHRLAGYDIVNSTPFSVDITPYVKTGAVNDIAVRITDPNGNFNWKDSQCYSWGNYLVNPSHGFGGITGRLSLQSTSPYYIKDVFVENTPLPNKVNINVETVGNDSLTMELRAKGDSRILWSEKTAKRSIELNYPEAKLWSLDNPNIYELTVRTATDEVKKRFGFRWFEVRDVDGDRQFYLNSKRVVLRTAISWSFWPVNGIAPSRELALKQVKDAKDLGLTMLNFHRTIGCSDVLDAADELGLLYFEEPGGNQYPANKFSDSSYYTRFYFKYRDEKLARMIQRDRSHPSLIIYNLHNERGAAPQDEDRREMMMAHRMDPSRIITYNSCNGNNPEGVADSHFKLHLLPNDSTFHDIGWWDDHHAGGPGVYHDNIYQGKDNYLRFSNNKSEIVYWGEEGAIGTPPRLQLIRDEILRSGNAKGWEAQDYLAWYDAYDTFLRERGFSKAFPCVDSLTRKMGNVAYYYQGRMMENIRISNTVDGYAVNGWESMKLENHSGIVDNYRNLKGDAELIARYNRPLYLAVKMNHKVMAVGDTTTVDVYIVNEKNVHGNAKLIVTAKDDKGNVVATFKKNVHVTGGCVYGENLSLGWHVIARRGGYTRVEATLVQGSAVVAKGSDDIFAVALNADGIGTDGLVADTTGMISNFMRGMGVTMKQYKSGRPKGDFMIVGAFEPTQFGSGFSDIMEWVYAGHTLVIVDNSEKWADLLCDKEVLDYRGSRMLGKSWYGGNFFCRNHPAFNGLPTDCVFNWEYQCFAAYNRRRIGLRTMNGDVIVGCVSDHRKEVYSAMTEIHAGRGRVIITTLDIPSCIREIKSYNKAVDADGMNESMNTFNSRNVDKSNVVGQQMLLNLARYASQMAVKE
jgi:beta-galactosidase